MVEFVRNKLNSYLNEPASDNNHNLYIIDDDEKNQSDIEISLSDKYQKSDQPFHNNNKLFTISNTELKINNDNKKKKRKKLN